MFIDTNSTNTHKILECGIGHHLKDHGNTTGKPVIKHAIPINDKKYITEVQFNNHMNII